MSKSGIPVDCVVFGGGVAGLWLHSLLRERGHASVLLEAQALGSGQTVASQGILHSGLKYSLKGLVSAAAREAREMPALWRRCLAGEQSPSLVGTEVRSESFYLWGTESASSRIGMLGDKLGLKVTPKTVAGDDRPELLQNCRGSIYQVNEQVLSPASLLETLSAPHADTILKIDPGQGLEFISGQADLPPQVSLRQGDETLLLAPRWIVLAAGAGNEQLRTQLGLAAAAMQRRPLHMVLMRGPLPEFYGHCVDGGHTRVSITSAVDSQNRVVWQVGGQIAEDGVSWSPDELIARAKHEIQAVLPALDLREVEWSTYRVDRAEGLTRLGGRPDSFRLLPEGRILTVWPTKLVLAPQLAEAVLVHVAAGRTPADNLNVKNWSRPYGWPRPAVALPPWETAEFVPAQGRSTCGASS